MVFSNQIKENPTLKKAFFELAEKVHHIDIAAWEKAGWWDESYIPYTYFKNGKAISNVSVFKLDFMVDGTPKHYIQVSTVMTDLEYRRQGLAGDLLLRAVSDWKNKCDGIFLFSSDMALKFYAMAGLNPKLESAWSYHSAGTGSSLRRLDLSNPDDMMLFRHCFDKGNPFSRLSAVNDLSLVMFHCGSHLADCIYYLESEDAVLIIDHENTLLEAYGGTDLSNILCALPQGRFELGFAPTEPSGLERKVVNRQLFWLGENCPADLSATCIPLLAHA